MAHTTADLVGAEDLKVTIERLAANLDLFSQRAVDMVRATNPGVTGEELKDAIDRFMMRIEQFADSAGSASEKQLAIGGELNTAIKQLTTKIGRLAEQPDSTAESINLQDRGQIKLVLERLSQSIDRLNETRAAAYENEENSSKQPWNG